MAGLRGSGQHASVESVSERMALRGGITHGQEQDWLPFGQLLRRLRARTGLTQEELASTAGVSTRSVSDLERGVNLTARKQTAWLLAALGLAGSERSEFLLAARGKAPERSGVPGQGRVSSGGVAAMPGRAGTDSSEAGRREVTGPGGDGGLSVAVPLGRLPAELRGRGGLLAEVGDSLAGRRPGRARGSPVRVWVLAGMGGLGKSAVALAAARTVRAKGWLVWWLSASDRASLVGGMVEVLTQLGAPELVIRPVREDSPTAADRAWEFLNGDHPAGRNWLLVLDNADHPAVLAGHGRTSPADHAGWFRPNPAGALIVTSRVKDPRCWGPGVAVRELSPLSDEDAASVLADLAPGIDDPGSAQARDLGRRLGGLPLALHLAGSYLASPFAGWRTFAGYRQALDSVEFTEVLADLDDPSAQARETVSRTWDISLDGLAADGLPQAASLLSLLSCFGPAVPIPSGLLQDGPLAVLLRQREGTNAAANRLIRHVLRAVSAVGLIDVIPGTGPASGFLVSVHPVVADVNRSRLLTTGRADLDAVGRTAVMLLASFAGMLETGKPADWPQWLQMVPHLQAMLSWLAPHLDAAMLARLVAVADPAVAVLRWMGNSRAGQDLAESCVTAASALGGAHPTVLTARFHVGQCLADQGHDRVAEAMYREILALNPADAGDVLTLAVRRDLAWIIECQGRYREAADMYRQLIVDQQKELGADHRETMTTSSLLARVTGLLGRYRDAEHMAAEALAAQRRVLGGEHPDVLFTWHNLAWMVGMQGRYEEAERTFRQLLATRQRLLGDHHPATLTSHLRHARLLSDLGRHREAEDVCRHVLGERQRILGDRHPATMTASDELGRVLGRQRRYQDAEHVLRQVLSSRLQIMSPDHPHALITRSQLASANRCRVLGPDHPDTLSTRLKLAEIAASNGRREEAIELCRSVQLAQRRAIGDEHPRTVITDNVLSALTEGKEHEPLWPVWP
jgi:tetratricopeptide (TPR) repeat protein/DNA-binding XRE family transcriptional regulator